MAALRAVLTLILAVLGLLVALVVATLVLYLFHVRIQIR